MPTFHEAEHITESDLFAVEGRAWIATHARCGGKLTIEDDDWHCAECGATFHDHHCADVVAERRDKAAREEASHRFAAGDDKAAHADLAAERALIAEEVAGKRASRNADQEAWDAHQAELAAAAEAQAAAEAEAAALEAQDGEPTRRPYTAPTMTDAAPLYLERPSGECIPIGTGPYTIPDAKAFLTYNGHDAEIVIASYEGKTVLLARAKKPEPETESPPTEPAEDVRTESTES